MDLIIIVALNQLSDGLIQMRALQYISILAKDVICVVDKDGGKILRFQFDL